MSEYRGFRDLKVYQMSYSLAIEIYKLTRSFPKEEKYSLTDQIVRSARSVPANITEARSKRTYPKHFVNKLTDSQGEAFETTFWLDIALDHQYINSEVHNDLIHRYEEVSKMLTGMINHPEKFCH